MSPNGLLPLAFRLLSLLLVTFAGGVCNTAYRSRISTVVFSSTASCDVVSLARVVRERGGGDEGFVLATACIVLYCIVLTEFVKETCDLVGVLVRL